MAYKVKEFGTEYTADYAAYITLDDKVISPFHDIPASCDDFKLVNVVNEIPRFSNAKKEINKELEYNPIKQDVKNGSVRFVKNMYPMKGYIWNYGAIPQTWESTEVQDTRTKIKGDNDPIDAIEIGDRIIGSGEVYKAKVLGAIAMIDGGECDWKVLVINTEDELFGKMNSLEDVEKYKPGLLSVTREWFRNYKVADKEGNSGSKNEFANEEQYFTAEEAIEIIKETNEHWKGLIKKEKHTGISLVNATQTDTPGYSTEVFTPSGSEHAEGQEPSSTGKFYFIN
ncbi:nucleosome-remodeling factor 38 kDa subunit [Nematocida minor]|uniref:nucleosome-remodeling factor 38 kDa subunit n=1 Tax=Nematocida minor TaxID=1912983 RepID=UPI002220C8A6|nr:nucleosome-remodeling factor 38 kDa subunit [Nematocida minor]KAI5192712.1 nucleosome-remodeling factor 38 kDa subunit [Nematocida minor]